MQRAIAGFATNMKRESIEVFLRSARKAHPEATDIYLITNDCVELSDILFETGAKAFHTYSTYNAMTSKTSKALNRLIIHQMRLLHNAGLLKSVPEAMSGYRAMLEVWHHPHFARWPAYIRLLDFLGYRYDAVFFADVKDVAFQSDIFVSELDSESVWLFKESVAICDDRWNREWVLKGYGKKGLRTIGQMLPVCAGTVGGQPYFLKMAILEFIDYILQSPFRTTDQGILNYFLYANGFKSPCTLIDNYIGPVATMAGSSTDQVLEISNDFVVRREDGSVMPVLHGYDRYPHFKEFICSKYT